MPPTLTSDHYATFTTCTVAPPVPPRHTPPQWNIRRADRAKFLSSLDEWRVPFEPLGNLHKQKRDLTAAIHRAADAAIPRNSLGCRHRSNWRFYNEEAQHRVNVHRKLYKQRQNPTNLRLLQDLVTRARQVSQRDREAKWLELCASFN